MHTGQVIYCKIHRIQCNPAGIQLNIFNRGSWHLLAKVVFLALPGKKIINSLWEQIKNASDCMFVIQPKGVGHSLLLLLRCVICRGEWGIIVHFHYSYFSFEPSAKQIVFLIVVVKFTL